MNKEFSIIIALVFVLLLLLLWLRPNNFDLKFREAIINNNTVFSSYVSSYTITRDTKTCEIITASEKEHPVDIIYICE